MFYIKHPLNTEKQRDITLSFKFNQLQVNGDTQDSLSIKITVQKTNRCYYLPRSVV